MQVGIEPRLGLQNFIQKQSLKSHLIRPIVFFVEKKINKWNPQTKIRNPKLVNTTMICQI